MKRANKKQQKQQAISFNPEQIQMVDANAGFYQVMAGPGSGKSAALVGRTARLLKDHESSGILLLTFTAEAAKELRTRSGFEKPEDTPRPCGPLTFHSLALSFATVEHSNFPFRLAAFPLATEGQSGKIAGDACRRHKVDYRELRLSISKQKRLRITPAEAIRTAEKEKEGRELALAYKEYEDRCRDAGVLDFDSLLVEMVNLLEANEGVRARWQYKWVMVDECQDTDELQFKLLGLITEKHKNLMAVGDVGQAIYMWRGAHPDLFLNMKEMFPDTKTIYLAKNHRSTQKLVSFISKIGPVQDLAEKFWTENPAGVDPEITQYLNTADESERVSKRAAFAYASNPDETIAILARTNRGLRAYEEWLAEHEVRYHFLGRSGFFSQPEVRAVLSYVQAVKFPTDSSLQTAIRAPFEPTRFIRKKELVEKLTAAQKGRMDDLPQWRILKDMRHIDQQQARSIEGFVRFMDSLVKYSTSTAKQAVVGILQDLRALEYYAEEEESAEADSSPVENLQELIRMAERFPTVSDLLDHARKMQNISRLKKGVALSTAHSSKGKEFNTVFVVDVTDGNMPHKKGVIEEEERIWFVACSRAAKELNISYSGAPSQFIQPFLKGQSKCQQPDTRFPGGANTLLSTTQGTLLEAGL